MVQLNAETTVLQFSHLDNTYNKRNLLEGAYYNENENNSISKLYYCKKNIYELIEKFKLEIYESILLPYKS